MNQSNLDGRIKYTEEQIEMFKLKLSQGYSYKRLKDEYGINFRTCKRLGIEKGEKLTEEQIESILDDRRKGMSIANIAEKYGTYKGKIVEIVPANEHCRTNKHLINNSNLFEQIRFDRDRGLSFELLRKKYGVSSGVIYRALQEKSDVK